MLKSLESANKKLYRQLYKAAIDMRNNPTVAEKILWQVLSNRPLGYKFRRQHILDRFIVDFYCAKLRLSIEVDSEIHSTQVMRDIQRDDILKNLGCIVLRFKNSEVQNDLQKTTSKIKVTLANLNDSKSSLLIRWIIKPNPCAYIIAIMDKCY